MPGYKTTLTNCMVKYINDSHQFTTHIYEFFFTYARVARDCVIIFRIYVNNNLSKFAPMWTSDVYMVICHSGTSLIKWSVPVRPRRIYRQKPFVVCTLPLYIIGAVEFTNRAAITQTKLSNSSGAHGTPETQS